ncbi:putative glyoxal oxidase [Lyophyllum shimeji]|uniref:Glyoxal oxidase n=1 Tax=Lyophyllum shimeji TaxID=47721 RepID=A0A9P3URE8_LYOSH|nr:putative glyoxal oxidase [Lyophyllum shimeji]
MVVRLARCSLWLALASSSGFATNAGAFVQVGDTLVSALIMFLGNEEKVYILDKAEGNAAAINGHPAWGSVWDISTQQATVMDVRTNTFCASGMHLPNGSYVTFGGNGAVGRGGFVGSQRNANGFGTWDSEYQDFDGSRGIRILNPCPDSESMSSPSCQWFDDPSVLSMQKQRWYAGTEALADGSVALIGGFVNGGYVNRNYPNVDPEFENGAAESTYEIFPANGRAAQTMQFMIKTSGLNSYAHAYLLNSGKMLVQANISTVIWEYNNNVETHLPDMPNNVARVYPASGAVAMLPLTPANNYTPTILFCGGVSMPDEAWGSYSQPAVNTWNHPASRDCQRLTPEPPDGSQPKYEADDDMLEGRTMGQFILLPDGTMLVINGALNGTAGYSFATGETPSPADMPYGMSLAAAPLGTPAIYDPNAPKGQRWSNTGLGTSQIARLYHSTAILLPDASVFVAGSNPNTDVNLTTVFPTTYKAEVFYPPYFRASTRPVPSGIPKSISYGGQPFDLTLSASSYTGSANEAAKSATVVLLRGGVSTHAMNMGQRYLQLNNTFTVQKGGKIVLHVAQAPNPNVFQPGPALLFVTISRIPSIGKMVIVGNGQLGMQPTNAPSTLPQSVLLESDGSGNATNDRPALNGAGTGTVGTLAVVLNALCLAVILAPVVLRLFCTVPHHNVPPEMVGIRIDRDTAEAVTADTLT